MPKNIIARINHLNTEIINLITSKTQLTFTEATKKFYTSTTYQLIQDIDTNYYLKDQIELFALWTKEQIMLKDLDTLFNHNQQRSHTIIPHLLKQLIIKKAFLENLSLEEAYTKYLQDLKANLQPNPLTKTKHKTKH